MAKYHPRFQSLMSTAGCARSMTYIYESISEEYYKADELTQELEDLKLAHLEEMLSLKEKISHLIDQNYQLHQAIRSNT